MIRNLLRGNLDFQVGPMFAQGQCVIDPVTGEVDCSGAANFYRAMSQKQEKDVDHARSSVDSIMRQLALIRSKAAEKRTEGAGSGTGGGLITDGDGTGGDGTGGDGTGGDGTGGDGTGGDGTGGDGTGGDGTGGDGTGGGGTGGGGTGGGGTGGGGTGGDGTDGGGADGGGTGGGEPRNVVKKADVDEDAADSVPPQSEAELEEMLAKAKQKLADSEDSLQNTRRTLAEKET